MTPNQCRAARGLLDMTQAVLAERAGIARKSLTLFEGGGRALMPNNLRAVRHALEADGVELLDGARAGVRFRMGRAK